MNRGAGGARATSYGSASSQETILSKAMSATMWWRPGTSTNVFGSRASAKSARSKPIGHDRIVARVQEKLRRDDASDDVTRAVLVEHQQAHRIHPVLRGGDVDGRGEGRIEDQRPDRVRGGDLDRDPAAERLAEDDEAGGRRIERGLGIGRLAGAHQRGLGRLARRGAIARVFDCQIAEPLRGEAAEGSRRDCGDCRRCHGRTGSAAFPRRRAGTRRRDARPAWSRAQRLRVRQAPGDAGPTSGAGKYSSLRCPTTSGTSVTR